MDEHYAPPAHKCVEFELQRPAPRALPELIYNGSYAKQEMRRIVLILVCAAAFFWYADSTVVQRIAFYVLPLGYLSWIALALALSAAWFIGRRLFKSGNYKWFVYGIPVIAKVADIAVMPLRHRGEPDTEWTYRAMLLYPDPGTGRLITAAAQSLKLNHSKLQRASLEVGAGDYATALVLPGRHEVPALYGFLNLNPEVEFVRFSQVRTTKKAIFEAAGLFLIFGMLLWNAYAFTFYQPVSFNHPELISWSLIGGMLGALPFAVLYLAEWRAAGTARNAGGIGKAGLLLGLYLLCSITAFCFLLSINGIADVSSGRVVEVRVEEVTEKTYELIFRQFSAKVILPGEPETVEITLGPENLAQTFSERGELRLRDGYFGWEWTDGFRFKSAQPSSAAGST